MPHALFTGLEKKRIHFAMHVQEVAVLGCAVTTSQRMSLARQRLERRTATGARDARMVWFHPLLSKSDTFEGACRDVTCAVMTDGSEDTPKGRRVCLKRFEHARAAWFNRELAMLVRCQGHPHVLEMLGWYGTASHMHIVTPMYSHTLRQGMARPSVVADPAHVLRDVVAGVGHLHSCGVLHRDIKPENVMLDMEHQRWVVIDLGLSRVHAKGHDRMTPNTCTLWYRAPELLVRSPHYSYAVDIWAVGCLFAETLLGGVPLFGGRTDTCQLQLIFHRLGVPGKRWWDEHAKEWLFGAFEPGTTDPTSHSRTWDDISSDNTHRSALKQMVVLRPRDRVLPR